MNRRQKIFDMLNKNVGKTLKVELHKIDLPEANLVFLPSYETTNGLSPEQRQCAINEYYKIYPIEDMTMWDSVSEDKTSGSEYCPPSSYDSNEISKQYNKSLRRKKNKQIRKKTLDRHSKALSNKKIRILQNIRIKNENEKIEESEQKPSDPANQLEVGSNKENVNDVADKRFLIEKYLNSIQDNNDQNTSQIVRTFCEENGEITEDNKICVTIPKKETENRKIRNIQERENEFGREERRNEKQSEEIDPEKEESKSLTGYEPPQDHTEGKNKRISNESFGKNTSDESFDRTFRTKITKNNIEIVAAGHKKDGKRVRNKTHVCYFCNKKIINMARHFETVHGNECEVAKYLAYPKNSKQRRQGFIEIIRIGDFYHNCNVMATKNGELVLIRRPTENEAEHVSDSDYGPCPNCLGFLLKKHIWHHVKHTCKEKITLSGDTTSKHVIAESNAIMADIFGFGFTKEYNDSILCNFKSDAIGDICRNDFLIMKFGAMQFEKYGNTQCEFIRQTMRQLGRLTLALKEISNDTKTKSLSDFLIPQKFDTIVQATKHVSNVMSSDVTSRPEFKTPSLALKIGYALKKCISIERGVALRAGNIKRNEALVSFLHLMEMEWNIRIPSNALSTLYKRKLNATQLLPITSDLVKLNKYIDSEISKVKNIVESKDRNNHSWTRLATFVLARVILFNKRRSGEAAKMKMSDYISRPCWKEQNTEEIQQSLTSIERKLAETLCIVEIEGKRGRKVPVILTPIVKDSIDILIRHRDACKINLHNKYVFARSNQSVSFLRGHDCLQKICEEIDLENPKVITSTKLRKYIATVCQLFNMSENEYDWLARHLGHDIRVHREFYRLHESAIELTKVSRLLMAVDQGEANRFAGKHIEDIELKELPNLEEDEEDKEDKEDKECEEDKEDFDGGIDGTDEEGQIQSFPGTSDTAVKTKACKKPKKTACPQAWEQCEKEAVTQFFKQHIKKNIVPKQQDCLNCIKENPCLASRNWKKVKYFVKNQIDKNKKMSGKK